MRRRACLLGIVSLLVVSDPARAADTVVEVAVLTSGEPVHLDEDGLGCSLRQFCEAIDTGTAFACRLADWKNDEPAGARDGRCVPSAEPGH